MNPDVRGDFRYCAAPPRTLPQLSREMPASRMRAIVQTRSKWVNGTTLRYHFHRGPERQRQAVRDAFAEWKSLQIGISFQEVDDPAEAEIRIGFDQSDGSWSYLGRDVLTIGTEEPTMNFGWDLTTPDGRSTALHEIGHTLGKPHEHQNPKAGIVWNEEAVYRTLGGPPNHWDQATTYDNIIRKLDPGEVEGSRWDPDSIMHYPFPGGLIEEPTQYAVEGIDPPGTLSALDQEYVRRWYPALEGELRSLDPFVSAALSLSPGEQADFSIVPEATREYSVGTFGAADAVLVLFEDVDGELRFRAGDDDSGEARNALLRVKLYKGRRYVARFRLYWAWLSGDTAVMLW
jgi:hypothetical protein